MTKEENLSFGYAVAIIDFIQIWHPDAKARFQPSTKCR